jgi:hypothetical protein
MQYTQLTNDYKYRHIANAIYAREAEYFHYDFDRINFNYMIANFPDGPFKDDIAKRIDEIEKQMQSVQAIIEALWAQVDDEQAYAKAVEYVTQEREKKEPSK